MEKQKKTPLADEQEQQVDPYPEQQFLKQGVLKLLLVVHQGQPPLLMQLLLKVLVFALHKINIANCQRTALTTKSFNLEITLK